MNRAPQLLVAVTLGLTALATQAAAGTVAVDAAANIYAAGDADTSAFTFGGVLPVAIDVLGSTQVLFSSVTAGPPVTGSPTGGATCIFDGLASSGDGNTCVSATSNIAAANGYSSFYLEGRTMPLVGLFVGDTKGATPTGLTSNFDTENAKLSFTPELQQVFLIGDGKSDGGVMQTFAVPTGARTLYLGFADASGFWGQPGFYWDNYGGLSVSYTTSAVPEPTAAVLALSGMLALMGARRARSGRA